MIQVHEQLDPALQRQVMAYLTQAPAESGRCGEHDPRWLEVLRNGLGHRPMALVAYRSGQPHASLDNNNGHTNGSAAAADRPTGAVCGYLPLALVVSRLFGRFLVSLPYLNRAGLVADDPNTAAGLVERAVELAREHDVQYLELRHHSEAGQSSWLGAERADKVRMVLALPNSQEALWKAINTKVRNQVRKGDKSGLSIQWGGRGLLEDYYSVFSVNMRDLGTPVYPRKLFGCILDHLGEQAELAVVYAEGQPVACGLVVHDPVLTGSTQVPSASSLRRFNRLNANMWMYHKLLCRAIERGSREFDFGRSSVDSGTYRFKKQWGAQPHPTVWQYHVRQGDINSMRPDSPRNRRRVATWQKLPVWLTRLVGPIIVRGIP